MADLVKSLMEGSSIVFLGTVRAKADKPFPTSSIPIAEKAGFVRIDAALEAPAVLGNLVGVEVIVIWRDDEPKDGTKAIFLTNAASYGERLILREIGRVATKDLRTVEAAIEEHRQRPLRTRVAESEIIVLGVVDEVRPPENPPTSFDDPRWATALIRAESTIKGRVSSPSIGVLFASSMDVRWYASPKLHPGLRGVFLIRRGENKEAPRNAYTILGPLDVQPSSALPQFEDWLAATK